MNRELLTGPCTALPNALCAHFLAKGLLGDGCFWEIQDLANELQPPFRATPVASTAGCCWRQLLHILIAPLRKILVATNFNNVDKRICDQDQNLVLSSMAIFLYISKVNLHIIRCQATSQ